jgi:pyruvate kinase
MLSGETAVGEYPIDTIQMMEAIICESEKHLKEYGRWRGAIADQYADDAEAIARAARELAHDLSVSAIVVFTQSGRTARIMSKEMPRVPIVGFTPDTNTFNKMALYRGVNPYEIKKANSLEEMLGYVDEAMVASTPISPGQEVVVVCSFPVGSYRLPNLALLHKIGTN